MNAIEKATLHHPIAFPNNMLKAKKAFSNGDWAGVGLYSGKDVKYMLDECAKTLDEIKPSEFEDFLDHFWLAAFDIPLALNDCTTKSQSSWKVIEKAIGLIKDHSNPIDVAMSAAYIFKHKGDFQVAFKSCTHAAPDLYKGFVQLKPFTSLTTVKDTSAKAMLHHPLGFPKNLKNGQAAIRDGRYADAGDYLGTDVHYMIDELP